MNDTMLNASSGIKTHQFGLDSISNNIANINTTGYKANDPQFKTLFSRDMSNINASSVTNNDFSYGVTGGSNNISTKSGSFKKADSDTAVAFTGKGWLVVGKNKEGSFEINDEDYKVSDSNYFTKNGDFTLDSDGYLVNSEGYYLYGVNLGKIDDKGDFTASQDPEKDIENLSKGVMKPISIPPQITYSPVKTTEVDLSVNLNKNQNFSNILESYTKDGVFNEARFFGQDLNALANNNDEMLKPKSYSDGSITITKDGVSNTYNYSYADGTSSQGKFKTIGQLQYLIKRDTGLELELDRDANGVINPKGVLKLTNKSDASVNVKISGGLFDQMHLSKANPFNLAPLESDYGTSLRVPSFKSATEIYDDTGKKYILQNSYYLANQGEAQGEKKIPEIWNVKTAIYEMKDDKMLSKEIKESVLLFDDKGKAIFDEEEIPFLGGSVKFSLENSTNKPYLDPKVNTTKQDGKQRGTLQNIRINDGGIISLSFSNGENEMIGRVGLAAFANDQGLKKIGGNLFALNPVSVGGEEKLLSGNPKLMWGKDSNLKNGQIMQGYVENSNVDVGVALTDLILMQRGYSMNAKAFTTGDDLIKEAIALKR